MNRQALKRQLIIHEGIRLKPYLCPAGRLTIGIGRNLDDKGITIQEAHFLAENDIAEVIIDLARIFNGCFTSLPEEIKLVLADMRFNLGPIRFRGFKKMIAAVRRRDWAGMVREMVDSEWYDEVGVRSSVLVNMVAEMEGGL